MPEETRVIQVNGRYKIIFERAAGIKTGDGFKIEANGDEISLVELDAQVLYAFAQKETSNTIHIGGGT